MTILTNDKVYYFLFKFTKNHFYYSIIIRILYVGKYKNVVMYKNKNKIKTFFCRDPLSKKDVVFNNNNFESLNAIHLNLECEKSSLR